ncbi:endocuticle structural glycoprotein ABD-5-like [Ctenocephalides felis]|uniref:endocuticle structural glycoprotein ABD-5-like n=1 Tax=Ctenocephalides felis TaxID=7515 RepID=UPI000E6E190A|nr:endocuticle structural glycoprotein ABD-5-like [Ctenocephalides felis]XP_026466737.1 endocuticle structural glycoprotein ABD-5-like [Ctenocephalides felis]
MKMIIVLAALVALVASAPQHGKDATVTRYEFDNLGTDGYKFAVDTSDGTSRQEQAELKNVGTENEALSVRGSYTFVGDDGQQYTVNFVADENGYQAEGAHLPRA